MNQNSVAVGLSEWPISSVDLVNAIEAIGVIVVMTLSVKVTSRVTSLMIDTMTSLLVFSRPIKLRACKVHSSNAKRKGANAGEEVVAMVIVNEEDKTDVEVVAALMELMTIS